jgi:hypothetical protein
MLRAIADSMEGQCVVEFKDHEPHTYASAKRFANGIRYNMERLGINGKATAKGPAVLVDCRMPVDAPRD